MERKIGETFEFKGKTYEVAELPDYFCAFCDLEKECYSKRSYLENVAGTCSPSNRMDTRNVCFKEIKKDMEIKDNNKLTINIPDGMEIDVENCDFDTGVIKFRKKELCYEDIENSLDLEGNRTGIPVDDKIYTTTGIYTKDGKRIVNIVIRSFAGLCGGAKILLRNIVYLCKQCV